MKLPIYLLEGIPGTQSLVLFVWKPWIAQVSDVSSVRKYWLLPVWNVVLLLKIKPKVVSLEYAPVSRYVVLLIKKKTIEEKNPENKG